MTIEGLMDEYLIADNTNVSFEIAYNSNIEQKSRFIRSAIDWKSNSETAKKIVNFMLEDVCNVYSVPTKLASQMNVLIDEMESSIKKLNQASLFRIKQLK
jgi:hypothetical protein